MTSRNHPFPHASVSRRTMLLGSLGGALALGGCAREATGPAPATSAAPTASDSATPTPGPSVTPTPEPTASAAPTASASQMAARATVPVLCYHQVRPYASGDSAYTKQALVIPPERFDAHLDAIAEAGWTTIGPDAYLDHLRTGAALPEKPVILTFDDGKDNQHATALPALAKRGMTGTWFIMTVVLGKKGWTAADDVRKAVDSGMTIGCHTWDHHDVRKYTDADFTTQFDEARATLQQLSGQPVETFAYPYGAWNEAALPKLEAAGFTTAFQLSDKPLDPALPQLTLRRLLAISTWSGADVVAKLDAFA
ncbi:MAG: polysaccharide deacetylase family protein [Propionibacteriaceae bacterium]|nr:polysaccharide deacetylase family protein [Propionibacteriaceae bacterium]